MAKTKKIKKLTNDELRARYRGRLVLFKDALGVEYQGLMLNLKDETDEVEVSHRQTKYTVPKKNVRWL
jgi:hypothetical protein